MSEIKWIKLSTEIFNDEAIELIEQMPEGDAILVIWFKLLVKAGQVNDCGLIYLRKDLPYTEEMLATVFHKPLTVIKLALRTFEQFGMIEVTDENAIMLSNWEKYQNIATLDKIRQDTRNRVAKFREKQKLLATAPVKEEKDEFSEIVSKWCGYKEEKGNRLNDIARQEFKKKLSKISRDDVSVARQIVDKAIANNWNNVFELDEAETKKILRAEFDKNQKIELQQQIEEKEKSANEQQTMFEAINDKKTAIEYLHKYYPVATLKHSKMFQQLAQKYDFSIEEVQKGDL